MDDAMSEAAPAEAATSVSDDVDYSRALIAELEARANLMNAGAEALLAFPQLALKAISALAEFTEFIHEERSRGNRG